MLIVAVLGLSACTLTVASKVAESSSSYRFTAVNSPINPPTPALDRPADIAKHDWLSGAQDCSLYSHAIDVLQVDPQSYILRQNPCSSAEAPFMYLFLGSNKAMLLDTGDGEDLPIADVVDELLLQYAQAQGQEILPLLVLHSHSHGDHRGGDAQFKERPATQLVGANFGSMIEGVGFKAWPEQTAKIDLGGREIEIIPTPGHHKAAITLYDPKNQWLLTGDSLYPGRLTVLDWTAYQQSVARLRTFAVQHPVTAILGGHIELSNDYKKSIAMTNYRPNEAALPLAVEDLEMLYKATRGAASSVEDSGAASPQTVKRFTLYPLNTGQRLLVNVLSALFS